MTYLFIKILYAESDMKVNKLNVCAKPYVSYLGNEDECEQYEALPGKLP